MWCGRKGIDCPDCGMFGECFRTAWCGLPDKYNTTIGTSVQKTHDNSNYQRREGTNTTPDTLEINGIKYRKVEKQMPNFDEADK